MFNRDEKIEYILSEINKDSSILMSLNYDQLVAVTEYLKEYKKFLLKKVDG